jgi:hypothetical protein
MGDHRPLSRRTLATMIHAFTVAVGFALGVAACASLGGAAGDTFAKATACPRDSVTVVARPDYHPTAPPELPPPPDVTADPSRLAIWRVQQRMDQIRNGAPQPCLDGLDAFEARGCGKQQVLCCDHPRNDMGRARCSPASPFPFSASTSAPPPPSSTPAPTPP